MKCQIKSPGSQLSGKIALPSDWRMEIESSARPPKDSRTNVTNSTPTALHAKRCDANFRWTPTSREWQGMDAASQDLLLKRRHHMNVYCSRLAMDPSREEHICRSRVESGIKLGISLYGAGAADWPTLKTMSRTALCRVALFPFAPQPTWWSSKGFALLWHSGQE